MKTLIAAMTFTLLIGFVAVDQGTAFGQVYTMPTVVESYYAPAPAYAYPSPYAYPAPTIVPVRRWAYSPVIAAPVVVGPRVVVAPPVVMGPRVVVAPPVVVGTPVVVGPYGRVFVPGRPIRNTVRVVLP